MTELNPLEGRVARDPATLWRRLVDGVLLLAPGAQALLRIGEPGGAVWELLAEPMTASELADELSGIFGARVEVVRADLAPVLRVLADSGAICAVAGPD